MVPNIRFRADDGSVYPDWKEKPLAEIFTERTESCTISDDAPLLSFTIEQGVIDPEDKKSNKRDFLIKDKENKKFSLTELDDIIYNPANLKFGAIHRNKLGRGVVSPIYAIFHTDQYPVFMEYVVRNPAFIKQSLTYLEGTVEKLKTLKPRDFLKMCVSIPSCEEQQKIADFLNSIDDIIEISEKEVACLERQQKCILQKIFSQEVRFKKADGSEFPDWVEATIGSKCTLVTKQTGFDYSASIKPALITEKKEMSYPYLQTKNFRGRDFSYDTDYYLPEAVAENFEKLLLNEPCLLFSIVGSSVGNVALFPAEKICFLGGAICVCKFAKMDELEMVYYYMLSEMGQSQIRMATKGAAQATVTIEDIRKFTVSMPCVEERKLITDFLSVYDEVIGAAKQELKKWKELKRGLLQQMFV